MSKILPIDDSVSALHIAQTILTEAGHSVIPCSTGKSAVMAIRRGIFDLIVTDIYMPNEDGLEVIQERKRVCPKVPVVAMSGIIGPGNMLKVARLLGACETVHKPYPPEALLAAVSNALATRSPAHAGSPTDVPVRPPNAFAGPK